MPPRALLLTQPSLLNFCDTSLRVARAVSIKIRDILCAANHIVRTFELTCASTNFQACESASPRIDTSRIAFTTSVAGVATMQDPSYGVPNHLVCGVRLWKSDRIQSLMNAGPACPSCFKSAIPLRWAHAYPASLQVPFRCASSCQAACNNVMALSNSTERRHSLSDLDIASIQRAISQRWISLGRTRRENGTGDLGLRMLH